jgi:pseudaminic acid cytidylyltransferase
LALVCCVYATAVFTTRADLVEARDLLVETGASFVFTATTFPAPIQRALRRLPDGSCEMLEPEHRLTRSQDLEEAYHDAGQFYWGTRDAWLSDDPDVRPSVPPVRAAPLAGSGHRHPEDWHRAELMLRAAERPPNVEGRPDRQDGRSAGWVFVCW